MSPRAKAGFAPPGEVERVRSGRMMDAIGNRGTGPRAARPCTVLQHTGGTFTQGGREIFRKEELTTVIDATNLLIS